MAMVKCPDCGKMLSDKAPACIGCGRPMRALGQSATPASPIPVRSTYPSKLEKSELDESSPARKRAHDFFNSSRGRALLREYSMGHMTVALRRRAERSNYPRVRQKLGESMDDFHDRVAAYHLAEKYEEYVSQGGAGSPLGQIGKKFGSLFASRDKTKDFEETIMKIIETEARRAPSLL